MAAFDVLIERLASRIRATTDMTLKTLTAVAVHVLTKIRTETAANSAYSAAYHRCTDFKQGKDT